MTGMATSRAIATSIGLLVLTRHERPSAVFLDSMLLELRRGFGAGIVTALARVDGRALGVVANTRPTRAGRSG